MMILRNGAAFVAWTVLLAMPAAAQQQNQMPAEFTFKVSGQELDVIAAALASRPFSEVAALIGKLREQVVAQQQPARPAVPPPVPEKKE